NDNEIFNMFTQEEQYTELLKPIPELHQVTQNDNDVSFEVIVVEQEKSTVSFLIDEKKKLKSDFKTSEDKLLDKQIQLEKKIKELNNIVFKTGQSIQTIHMLSPKPDSFYHTEQKMALGYQNPFYLKQAQKKQQSLYDGKMLLDKHDPPVVHDSKETLQLTQESRDKMKQMNKEIKPANYTKINHLSGVFVPQKALSLEELYFSNNFKTANVSKYFLIPNEDLSDDTTPSVARKFVNEAKRTILTLQRVVKQRMTIETHNWASFAHQEFHKIVREEIFPIVNQVNARVQNFEIQFLKETAKFVGDFKSLAKEDDDSLAKHKAMELDNERLLKAVVSQDVMNIVQKESVVDTSNLQTELERMKEHFENYIIKKETEYAKLWNDWYKKCNECKYDKISQMQMVGGNSGNQFRQHAGQNARNLAGYNDVIGNQIRCYNCRGIADLDDIEEVNAKCILMANLQQASTSGTQFDSTPVYDTDGSAEVHKNYDDNEIFNMFTQEEQYTELLEPILELHQVPHNDNDVVFEVTGVEQGGEIV
nr:hypothetical protein [Tanacetum cinerariifolium]